MFVLFLCTVGVVSSRNFNRNERLVAFEPSSDDVESDSQILVNRGEGFTTRFSFPSRTPVFSYVDKSANSDFDQSFNNNDRLDFHYPKVEFLTKIDRKYHSNKDEDTDDEFLFMKSQKFVSEQIRQPNRLIRKNRFKVPNLYKNDVQYQPIKLSFVQKPSDPESNYTKGNKYEENEVTKETGKKDNTRSNTKNNIHDFLKSYFMKLYSKKFNNSEGTSNRPSAYSKLTDTESDAEEAEKKFIGGFVSKIKQKAADKSKLFSLFTIVQFNNTQCNATSSSVSYVGVCYTGAECNRIEGTAVGNCASGYGVCCVGK